MFYHRTGKSGNGQLSSSFLRFAKKYRDIENIDNINFFEFTNPLRKDDGRKAISKT